MTAQVVPVRKTKWAVNPVSGHSWPEYTYTSHFRVVGGNSLGQTFSSEKKAQEHADWLNTLYRKAP